MQNPFTLTFGRSPLESVDRPVQINEIIENFTADTINQQMFIITGGRGSGGSGTLSGRKKTADEFLLRERDPGRSRCAAV